MPVNEITTTLAEIKKHDPCVGGWQKILTGLGKAQLAKEFEHVEKVEGVTYIRREGELLRPELYPSICQGFAGLDAILAYRRYINEFFDSPDMLYGVGSNEVKLFCSRRYGVHVLDNTFALATAPAQTVTLGSFMPLDKFMLMLKTAFVRSSELENLISVIGNVRYEDGLTIADDGISQEAHAKTGIHLVEKASLPADLMLTRNTQYA